MGSIKESELTVEGVEEIMVATSVYDSKPVWCWVLLTLK